MYIECVMEGYSAVVFLVLWANDSCTTHKFVPGLVSVPDSKLTQVQIVSILEARSGTSSEDEACL